MREAWNQWFRASESDTALASAIGANDEPARTLEWHGVELFNGMRFLDVGVGVGRMARYVSERGAVVDGLDISDEARIRAKDCVTAFYLVDEIDALPSMVYDVALAHLVAQHLTDKALATNLVHVYRALKIGGQYSLQFADDPFRPSDPPSVASMGAVFRGMSHALKLCATTCPQADVAIYGGPQCWPGMSTYYYYVHIRKP